MIAHTVNLLEKVGIKDIVVVVGFAKKSVISVLGNKVIFAEQKKRLGTGHAALCGLKKLPRRVDDVLIINGDDSAFYPQSLIKNLIKTHFLSNAAITFLTIDKDNPFSLGRIVRNKNGQVIAIAEEKDATKAQRKITEINPGCYLLKVDFLKKYLNKIEKSMITGEYYLTSIIDLGIKNNEKIETLKGGSIAWRGVNTKDELMEAEKLFPLTKIVQKG
jgi:bifunctional UDP-N-acetylglucosamine pyrophosphorylase/glucosamine-1-phosphate N-acetyltransferase